MKFFWTEGKNLAFPVILSRNVTTKDLCKHQLKHKKIPRQKWPRGKYFIVHDDNKGTSDEFFSVIKQNKNGITRFNINNDKLIKISNENKKEQVSH